MNIWLERVIRDWIDNKWGGWPAFLCNLSTMLSIAIGSAGLGWLWSSQINFISDALLIALWAGAGLIFGWFYVVLRRPS